MKKQLFIICCCFATMSAMAATHIPASGTPTVSDSLTLIRIENRVADIQSEIQSLDIQYMSIEEKHSLRSEIKNMIQQVKATRSYHESRHPYRVGAISSTGVAAIILYALYFSLKCI